MQKHKKVAKIYYPGDPSAPEYELAKKQMRDFGGMISFELVAGADVKAFIEYYGLRDILKHYGPRYQRLDLMAVANMGERAMHWNS